MAYQFEDETSELVRQIFLLELLTSDGKGGAATLEGLQIACVVGAAALVWFAPDLVRLNIAAQVLDVFLLPLVIGFLVALAVKALPEPLRLRGFYLWVLIGILAIVIAVCLFGGVSGLL